MTTPAASFVACTFFPWRTDKLDYFPPVILTLPDEPALASFNESELKLELAVALFSSGRVSRSVATGIAGLDRFAFDEELFRRRIPTFTPEMVEQDLVSIRSARIA